MKRTPLRAKRDKPRRNEGRVQHKRIKDKAGAPPTAMEQRHMDRVAKGGCILCGQGPTVLHHVMKCAGKTKRRDHRFVARLCPAHHNMGDKSVHLLGSEEAFKREHGFDLAAWAMAQWKITERMEQ